jgi:hypothetical protein
MHHLSSFLCRATMAWFFLLSVMVSMDAPLDGLQIDATSVANGPKMGELWLFKVTSKFTVLFT